MSECESRYEFGDPIWIKTPTGEAEGFYGEKSSSPDCHWCVRRNHQGGTHGTWVKSHEIRPRHATPRTGWRLPEPGDVIATTPAGQRLSSADELTVYRFEPSDTYPIRAEWRIGGTRYVQCFGFDQVRLVRLHDAPQPEPPAPVPRSSKQNIIDNAKLEMAAVTLEQDGHDHVAAMLRDLKRDWGES